MLRVTRWHPDTCDCKIEFHWDDAAPEEEAVITPLTAKRCEKHKNTGTAKQVYDAIAAEQRAR